MTASDGLSGHTYLRLSLTDRCNMVCRYCRPEPGPSDPSPPDQESTPRASDAELLDLVRIVHEETAIYKVRLSGGDPLMDPHVVELTSQLRALLPNSKLAITTNGTLLDQKALSLRQAGIEFVNISLDSLDPTRFAEVTGGANVDRTLSGVRAAVGAGYGSVKINTVLIRRINGDQLPSLVRFASQLGCEIRFIELMPFGYGARLWQTECLPASEAFELLASEFRYLGPLPDTGTASRHEFLVDGQPAAIGLITPISRPFCSCCDRLRLNRSGQLLACLRQASSVDLLTPLRGRDESALRQRIRDSLSSKQAPGEHWPQQHMVTIGG